MTNAEWIDLLSKEWNVSKSLAKEMLYHMYQVKRFDVLRKECQNAKGEDEGRKYKSQIL